MKPTPSTSRSARPFIGTQVSLASFHRYGVARILDHLQTSCGVNTIRLHADDRVRSAEEFCSLTVEEPATNLCGLPINPANYRDTAVRCQPYMGKLPAARRLGLIEELRRELDARDMSLQVRCILGADTLRDSFSAMLAQDENGQILSRPCVHNPHFLGFLRGVAEDVFRTAPIRVDGYLHMFEQSSLFGGLLTGGHLPHSCFCSHCRQRAATEGIDPAGARQGRRALATRVGQALAGGRPLGIDGLHSLHLDYPELAAWDAMQWRGYFEAVAQVRGTAKICQPESQVGVHMLHLVSWSIFDRPAYRPETLAATADFIKPILYHTFSGLRCGGAAKRFHSLFVPHLTPDAAFTVFLALNGFDPSRHPAWTDLSNSGELEPDDYVRVGIRHYNATPGWNTPIYANVGWEDEFAATPAPDPRSTRTYRAVRAAIAEGAPGIFLSRQFAPELIFGSDRPIQAVSLVDASAGGSKTFTDGDVGPRSLAAYRAALQDAGWIACS